MTARRAPRSQHGPKAEARRRVVERMGEAEGLLGAYIAAGEEIADLAAQVKAAEADQAQALAQLAALVGRPMAAGMAQVDESRVRSALAKKPAGHRRNSASSDGPNGSGDDPHEPVEDHDPRSSVKAPSR